MIHWEHTWKAPPHKVLPQAGFVCKCCNADMDKMAAAKITKDAPNVVQPAYLKNYHPEAAAVSESRHVQHC